MKKTGIAEKIRAEMKKRGRFCVRDLVYADYDGYISKVQVRNVIRDVSRSGEIQKIGRGEYEYIGKRKKVANSVQQKVYRAMYARGLFTVKELMVLTDADKSYITQLIRACVDAGELMKVGRKDGSMVFRVRERDSFYLKKVKG